MGIRPIETNLFIKYLESLGLICIRHESSHYTFDYPPDKQQLDRPIIVRVNKKEIPLLHIHINLKTLGVSHKEFEDWLKLPKKKRK
jgi:hypothetical protein